MGSIYLPVPLAITVVYFDSRIGLENSNDLDVLQILGRWSPYGAHNNFIVSLSVKGYMLSMVRL